MWVQHLIRALSKLGVAWGLALIFVALAATQRLDAAEDTTSPAFSEHVKALIQSGPLSSSDEELVRFAEHASEVKQKQSPSTEEPRVENLLSATLLHFYADGRIRDRTWKIFRIKDRDAASYAGQVVARWSPWRMSRPKLAARVVDDDGRAILNDGAAAFERSANDGFDEVHTDDKELALLLHGVDEDSLVETVTDITVSPALLKCSSSRCALTGFNMSCYHIVQVTADPGIEPLVRMRGSDVPEFESKVSGSQGFQRTFCLKNPKSMFESYEPNAGPDRCSFPLIEFSLPADWKSLGRAYSEKVDQAITDGNNIVRNIVSSAGPEILNGTPKQKVDWARETVKRLARYTGVEFGQHQIFPVSPDVVIQRRFGDCKDQACLFISLLRELNVKAHVALIAPGNSIDIAPESACLDLFSHAIAYVEPLKLWVDLTAEPLPGDLLPHGDRGRRTLICRPEDSELLTTPVYGSESSITVEHVVYRMNFTGGAYRQENQIGTGVAAREFAERYRDDTAESLLSATQAYTKQVHGVELASFRTCQPDEQTFYVQNETLPHQAFDRIGFSVFPIVDGRSLLNYFPPAMLPSPDDAPNPQPARKIPLHLVDGYVAADCLEIQFPSGLKFKELPESWSKTFGTVQLSVSIEQGPTKEIGLQLKDGKWNEWISDATRIAEETLPAYDTTLKFRFAVTVEPGKVAVADVQKCRDFLRSLSGEGGDLVLKLEATWKALDDYVKTRNESSFRRFLADVQKYQVLSEPHILLLVELAHGGLRDYAVEQAKQYRRILPHQSIAAEYLPQLKLGLYEGRIGIHPSSDVAGLKILAEECGEILAPAVRASALLADPDGMRTQDLKQIREAHKVLQDVVLPQSGQPVDQIAQASLYADFCWTGLALNEDEAFLKLIDQRSAPDILQIWPLLRNDPSFQIPFDRPMMGTREQHARIIWELLIVANRFDLVNRLESLLAEEASLLPLKINGNTMPEIASDDRDPVSVARRALVAMLDHEPNAVRELFTESKSAIDIMGEPYFGPSATNSWFMRIRGGRSSRLIQTVIALIPANSESIGEYAAEVTFRHPAGEPFKLLMLKDPEKSVWRAVTSGQLAGPQLRQLVESAKTQEAERLMRHLFPPRFGGLFGLFEKQPPKSPAESLWRSLAGLDLDLRIRLTAEAMAAFADANLSRFDELVEASLASLSSAQLNAIGEFRVVIWQHNHNSTKLYEWYLAKMKGSPTRSDLLALLKVIRRDRAYEGKLATDNRWQTLVADQLKAYESDSEIQGEYLLCRNKVDEALSTIERGLATTRGAANNLLWKSLLCDESPNVIRERLQRIENSALAGTFSVAYLHTLTCAAARSGQPLKALQHMEKLVQIDTSDSGSNDLCRGLILEEIGYVEDAAQMFQKVVQESPRSDSSTIAGNALRRIHNENLPPRHPTAENESSK